MKELVYGLNFNPSTSWLGLELNLRLDLKLLSFDLDFGQVLLDLRVLEDLWTTSFGETNKFDGYPVEPSAAGEARVRGKRSLPTQDIQAVVECGCPNLFRKVVNSAKRLRAFLQLDEADVCSACNLRGSCDKAYVIAKDNEGARTVDVVRILLSYAVDPVSLSGEYSVKANVQESARKLLTELIKLSDTAIDPSLPKPAVVSPSQKEPFQKVVAKEKQSVGKGKQSPAVEMKRGDWLCPNCNFLNFARNLRCLECKENGPKRVDFGNAEMKLGDWTCPECQFMNFARNKKCFRCLEPRPKRPLNPGEWECPSCDYLNFRRNKVCLKCNCNRPEEEGSQDQTEDHVWRRPKESKNNTTFKFGDDEDEEEEDDLDDILPLEGERKFVVSKRATPAERRSTSARRQNYSS
ncbi:zinc finger protein VAR3, chloroplastic-like isoform X3 [Ananas comosus]|uniref:Zinc finger protein VAR3, chloroplastic-like isoform X3 n=1 Tax=Ananas comosus TaxID=4615 RepID=A0A6P5EZE7_ANACO|nr:zinc finger protein VAR3, chloroplastic-like isoform X3 [Ananas comosus]XP_020088929.1 zinc finger protein VAR3, chloroplastic-like isoform X3 [Ananas comosus]